MPLKSKAQAAYLKYNKPEIYEEFKSKTKKGTKLPLKKGKRNIKKDKKK